MRWKTTLVVVGAVAIAFTAVGVAADTPRAVGDRPIVRVAPERAVNGMTAEEHLAARDRLHALVTSETPAGTLSNRIRIKLTEAERADLRNVVPVRGEPLRIGTVKTMPGALSVSGIVPAGPAARVAGGSFEHLADGGFSWAISVESEGAHAIRVHVTNFTLPVNAEMYFFDTAGEAYGPYTGKGRHGTGEFWTDSVRSDTGVILVRQFGPAEPDELRGISFTIDKVGHIGNGSPRPNPRAEWSDPDRCGWGGNPPCVEDANCGSVAPANQSAIAKMEWIAGCCIYTCTGGTIADTDTGSQRNLFLTANHCLRRANHASALETFFEYTTSSCEGTCPGEPPPHTSGATILATSRDGDFTLLELNQDPPAGTTFLGWNNSPIASADGAALTRVSNPNYGPQVLSRHSVDTDTSTCNGLPRGEFIYSVDTFGATDGGSSGSPVVNSSGEVVGQLYGCCGFNCADSCDPGSNWTVDGALAFYYGDVAEFLDPAGCTPSPEICDNNQDDDCDGDEDCADADCVDDPACQTGCVNPGGAPAGTSCVDDIECCSNKCKGRQGNKTCK